MKNKGFSLIETLIAVFLIGIITVSILPIVYNSIERTKKEKIKEHKMYLAEMTIENIRSYKKSEETGRDIHGVDLNEIIDKFANHDTITVDFSSFIIDEGYSLEVRKENRSEKLWELYSKVYYINEGEDFYVEYKAYMPKP